MKDSRTEFLLEKHLVDEDFRSFSKATLKQIKKAGIYSLKELARISDKTFDALSVAISQELQASADQTMLNKIDKQVERKLDMLKKQARFHKEAFVRIIGRMEDEISNMNKEN